MPIFTSGFDTVKNGINNIVNYQTIIFDGSTQSINNEVFTLLTVEIINPSVSVTFETIPREDSILRGLSKQIALEIKKNLKDSLEFQNYKIAFTQKNHDWQLSSATRYYWYKSVDL